jgi:hypothetical protein
MRRIAALVSLLVIVAALVRLRAARSAVAQEVALTP